MTRPGAPHVGSGSPFETTRHAHGASPQYDDHVRQSPSEVQVGLEAGGAAASGRSCGASFAGLLLVLQAASARTRGVIREIM
jgi:hypothetical protein